MSKHIRYIFLPFLVIVFFSSCKKKTPEDIGLPLLPGEDLLNAQFTDTATLITHTIKEDSLNTNGTTTMLLGNLNDPIFGMTKSSIFTQFDIPSGKTNPTFGTNPTLDSAVLSMVYTKSFYGDTTAAQKFDVYELKQDLHLDSIYYSNRSAQYYYYTTQQIGSTTIVPHVHDSVMIGITKFPSHIRIPLSKGMFQNFLDDPAYTASYTSTSSFQKVFKGIYVTSSSTPATGAILYLKPADAYSRITLYYHNPLPDTLEHSYYFGVGSDCVHFMHFDHDYSMTADIQFHLNEADTAHTKE